MNKAIFILGMPGAGKSSFARFVSKRLDLPFLDIDTQVEKSEGRTIKSLIEEKGEEFFRLAEAKELRALDTNTLVLVAVGGGLPCYHDNMQYMNLVGTTFYLEVELDTLISNYKAKNIERPLLGRQDPNEYLTKLYFARKPYYETSKYTHRLSSYSNESLEAALQAIRNLIGKV